MNRAQTYVTRASNAPRPKGAIRTRDTDMRHRHHPGDTYGAREGRGRIVIKQSNAAQKSKNQIPLWIPVSHPTPKLNQNNQNPEKKVPLPGNVEDSDWGSKVPVTRRAPWAYTSWSVKRRALASASQSRSLWLRPPSRPPRPAPRQFHQSIEAHCFPLLLPLLLPLLPLLPLLAALPARLAAAAFLSASASSSASSASAAA